MTGENQSPKTSQRKNQASPEKPSQAGLVFTADWFLADWFLQDWEKPVKDWDWPGLLSWPSKKPVKLDWEKPVMTGKNQSPKNQSTEKPGQSA